MMEGMLKRGQVLIARNMQSAAVIEDTVAPVPCVSFLSACLPRACMTPKPG
jgi:hypothetical protein